MVANFTFYYNNIKNSSSTDTYFPSQKPSEKDEQDIWETPGEARTNIYVMFFCGPLHIDVPVLANQQELIYISFVRKVWKTCLEQWMIGMDRESQ